MKSGPILTENPLARLEDLGVPDLGHEQLISISASPLTRGEMMYVVNLEETRKHKMAGGTVRKHTIAGGIPVRLVVILGLEHFE